MAMQLELSSSGTVRRSQKQGCWGWHGAAGQRLHPHLRRCCAGTDHKLFWGRSTRRRGLPTFLVSMAWNELRTWLDRQSRMFSWRL